MDIKIINSWADVTVSQYVELASIEKGEYNDNLDKGAAMISVLYNINALKININDFTRLAATLKFMTQPINKNKVKSSYELNGKIYQLYTDYTSVTTAQYIDYTNYQREGDIIGLLSVVLIPDGHDYCDGGYSPAEARNDIEKMNIEDALGIVNFFLESSATLIQRTLHFLRYRLRRTLRKKDREKARELNQKIKELEAATGEFYRIF